jgi:hypothetical protein
MSCEVIAEQRLYTLEWDDGLDAIVYTWDEFAAGETFRDGANDLLEVSRERDTSKLIVDTSGIRARGDDQVWPENEWVPKIIDAGIEHSATVHADSTVAKTDIESSIDDVDGLHTVMMTDSIREAREWTAEQ